MAPAANVLTKSVIVSTLAAVIPNKFKNINLTRLIYFPLENNLR